MKYPVFHSPVTVTLPRKDYMELQQSLRDLHRKAASMKKTCLRLTQRWAEAAMLQERRTCIDFKKLARIATDKLKSL